MHCELRFGVSAMKFSDRYPNMREIVDVEDCMIRGRQAQPCFMCGEETVYIEICAEAHFCSEECVDRFYEEFADRVQRMAYEEEEF